MMCSPADFQHSILCKPLVPLQVSDPVAAEFSLNTQMFLLSKKEIWLSDGSMGFGEGSDAAFSDGKSIDPW